jgi:hypothetical protein
MALVTALKATGGDTNTNKLIKTMEGMSFDTPKGKMTFRKEDHQAMQSMYHFKIKVDPAFAWGVPELVREIKTRRNERADPQQALMAVSFVPAANVVYKKDIAAEHALVTDDYGSACSVKGSPYINDCNFDLAGAMLQHLYGPLNARSSTALPESSFVEFKQSSFISGHGMASNGWAYIPQACQSGATCRLHVALHGCKQNVSDVQQQYVRNTGFNRWAETNHIVVLYPQTSTAATNSCWDWWGYDSANYAKKTGPQMAAIKAMVDRLGSGGATPPDPDPVLPPAPTGVSASGATASSMALGWNSVAGADGYHVYRNGNKVNALTVYGTSYTDSGLGPPPPPTSWTVRAADAHGAWKARPPAPVIGHHPGGQRAVKHPPAPTASNYAHTLAGRAYALYGFHLCQRFRPGHGAGGNIYARPPH